MDLTKTIKINNHYEISYGRILITSLITLFEVIGIICFNNWQIHPSIFFLISNMFLTLTKRNVEDELCDLEDKIDKNRDLILEQNNLIKEIKDKAIGGLIGNRTKTNDKRKKKKN